MAYPLNTIETPMSTANQRILRNFPMELPARSIDDIVESLLNETGGLEVDLAREARMMSSIEWQCDLRAAASKHAIGLL